MADVTDPNSKPGQRILIALTPNPALDLTYTVATGAEFTNPGDVIRARTSTLEASGKGVNIARALTAVGVACTAVLPVGGATGRQLLELLDDEGVSHRASAQAGPTRINTTVLRARADTNDSTTKLNGPGATVTEAECQALLTTVEHTLATAPDDVEVWLVVCGSLPSGMPSDIITRCIALAHRYAAKCAVDSSGAALTAALRSGADLLAPNRIELLDLLMAEECPSPADSSEQIAGLAQSVAALSRKYGVEFLVSLGEQGALYVDPDHLLHGHAPALNPVNTAGAGDALLAGWFASPGETTVRLEAAIRWGRSACLATTTVDPNPGRGNDTPILIEDLAKARPA